MSFIGGNLPDNDWSKLRQILQRLSVTGLGPASTPTFADLYLTDLTASRLVSTDASKLLSSVSNLQSWIAGTTNQITTADDGDGTLTLSLPQDIHTGASPTFAGLSLGSGTFGAGAITGTSFIIGANTLDTTEWSLLDGVTANKLIDWTAASENLYTTGTGRFDGSVGIGVAPSASQGLYILKSNSISTGAINGVFGGITNTYAGLSGTITTIRGLDFEAAYVPTIFTVAKTVTTLSGAQVRATVTSPTDETKNITISSLIGYSPLVTLTTGTNSTGLITNTNQYQFKTVNPTLTQGSGATYAPTITTLYGFYDVGLTAGATNWGLAINTQSYICAPSSGNSLSIGKITAPNYMLDVVGTIYGSTTIEAASNFRCNATAGVSGTIDLTKTATVVGGIITAIS